MPIEIKRWKCKSCKKNFSSKSYAEKHEHRCFFNLENKTCPTCNHFNGCFHPATAKCSLLNRKNEKTSVENPPFEPIEFDKFNVFTEFLIYNCEFWESKYDEVEDEEI